MLKHDHSRAARAEARSGAGAVARAQAAGATGLMGKTLDHLPTGKRHELTFVVEILTKEFKKEISTRWSPHLNQGQILKIILFGSYTRGDWVEDPLGRYFSDYDLLVVVENHRFTDVLEFWEGAEARFLSELAVGLWLRTPVKFIVHTLEHINDQLSNGRYFFVDIVRDGVPLLELPGHEFAEPLALAPETALVTAEGHFVDGMGSANQFRVNGFENAAREWGKLAAFNYHQATENLYNCLLLVLTLYTPKSHNLVRLRGLSEPLDPRLASVWPTDTKFQKRCFELLRAAYVSGRYSPQFKVTTEELSWMHERIEILQRLIVEICEARIAAFRNDAPTPSACGGEVGGHLSPARVILAQ